MQHITMQQHISTQLLDLMRETFHITNHYPELFSLLKLMEAISKAGWVEHTSDWDIGATIELSDKSVINVEQGYGDCIELISLDNNKEIGQYQAPGDYHDIYLEIPETDEKEIQRVDIRLIKAITFYN